MSSWSYKLVAVNDDGSVDISILQDSKEVYTGNLSQIDLGTPQVVVENPDAPEEEQSSHIINIVGPPPVNDATALDVALQTYLNSYVAGIEATTSSKLIASDDVKALVGIETMQAIAVVTDPPVAVSPPIRG